jgi:ATP-dependent HslUV protease subunit HslV
MPKSPVSAGLFAFVLILLYNKQIIYSTMERLKSTTVVAIRHNGEVVIGADGQATLGNTIAKSTVNKIRKLQGGKIVTGFAGSTADAFTLLEKFEEKLGAYGNNMKRAAVELAKEWRTDRMLSKLEAMMIVADSTDILIISGTGDVIEPDLEIATIGSGSMYAQSAARALKKFAPELTAEQMVRESLGIAADVCIYTNHNLVVEKVIR